MLGFGEQPGEVVQRRDGRVELRQPPGLGQAVAQVLLRRVGVTAAAIALWRSDFPDFWPKGNRFGGVALALMFLILAAVGLVAARFQRRNPIGYLLLGRPSAS